MIRFIDMRAADVAGCRFAFWNTVVDGFVRLHASAWDTWDEFEGEFREAAGATFSNSYPLERFKGLCPAWVFAQPPIDGVCYHCGSESHEPEECTLSIAEATLRACGRVAPTEIDVHEGTVTRIEPGDDTGIEFAVVTVHGQEVARMRQYPGQTTEGDKVTLRITVS